MPLLSILSNNPGEVYSLTIEQIVAVCGKGKLADSSECSTELRGFFIQAPSERLFEYIETCLDETFDKSGFVLQDLVNELGRRLDFTVENGLYSGKQNAIGFDGIWSTSKGRSLVIEVKTTDTYRINLDTIATYRAKLISNQKISHDSSILIVVGRQDTGDLEAQVRGSRHAWDIRLISVDALIKLVKLKEATEEDTVAKIRELLVPFEYTRVDQIIDIAFTAVQEWGEAIERDRGPAESEASPDAHATPEGNQEKTPYDVINEIRGRIIHTLQQREGEPLVKRSSALYWSADPNHRIRIACTVSKRYERTDNNYWYAYHPNWDRFLAEGTTGYFVLGCVDRNVAYAIPLKFFRDLLPDLYKTQKKDGGYYWHVLLADGKLGKLVLKTVPGARHELDSFVITIPPK